jgi:hypothetical protein
MDPWSADILMKEPVAINPGRHHSSNIFIWNLQPLTAMSGTIPERVYFTFLTRLKLAL